MNVTNQLVLLKKSASATNWSRYHGKFRAIHGKRGMLVTLPLLAKRYEIIQIAKITEKELRDAKEGKLTEEAQKNWER